MADFYVVEPKVFHAKRKPTYAIMQVGRDGSDWQVWSEGSKDECLRTLRRMLKDG